MRELWDVYDKNKIKTGKIVERGNETLKEGEYHLVVNAVIINSEGKILLAQRAAHKEHGLKWEFSGGSVVAGEDSLQGILRELYEEIGLRFCPDEAILYKEDIENEHFNFSDLWIFNKDVSIENDIKFNDGETINAKWVTLDEFLEMNNNKELAPSADLTKEDYNKIIKLIEDKRK